MSRRTARFAVLALIVSGLVLVGPAVQAVDYDCADFSTQAQAQKYLLPGDPYRLDADGDGVACELLPCSCSSAPPGDATTGQPAHHQATLRQPARVVRVIDGDTVDVRLLSGAQRRVRLLGIDTPEVYGGVECYGRAASRLTKRLLQAGTRVRLVSDPTQQRVDRYGRILRYVMKGRTDVDRTLVGRGAARVYVYAYKPFTRTHSYRVAQRAARHHHRGLWGQC